jgi:flavin reductase (DIM6/NTAB) family NADH-FMN oxidoreductase RutF
MTTLAEGGRAEGGRAEGGRVDGALFRALFRRQAASVAVVTVAGEPPVGFTATSLTSVSLDPPLLSVCLDRGSSSWLPVVRAEYLGVHLLADDQRDVARTFATTGIDRFAAHGGAWRSGPRGVPLLDAALAWLVCRVTHLVPAGDHGIVLAAPLLGGHRAGRPLLYHDGTYGRVA